MKQVKKIFLRLCSILFVVPAFSLSGDCSTCLLRKPLLSADPTVADYVIVGMGTAGAVVAKKLSDNNQISVVALHNGENLTQDPDIKLSKNAFTTIIAAIFGIPPFSTTGLTTRQPFADNERSPWVMGLPFGGTSSVNAGAYCRGTNEVYAQWEAIGGPKWSVNRILNTYKSLENYHGQTTDPSARGYHGPLSVRQNPVPNQISQTFTNAIISGTGFPFVLDYNDPDTPIGPSLQMQYTQSGPDGRLRVSSATAFLNNKVMTPNGFGINGRKLRVLFNSTGLRTIWKGNTAIGVEYVNDGIQKRVLARKGVIVSSGLFSSPFLLHSGIGPKNLLVSLKIPVIFDNPNVGQALADQPHVLLTYSTPPNDTPANNHNSIFNQIAWLPDPIGDQTVRQFRLSSVTSVPGITSVIFDLVQPKSRGSISIKSNNPLDPPIVNAGLLTNSDDLNLFVRGFQTYIQDINIALPAGYQMLSPPPSIINDTNQLIEFIKAEIGPNQHWQCHCRMAPLNQGGVVNSNGGVHGVKNLYVVDNSISPVNMDGSPMATGYLIGANIARILNQINKNE